MRFIQNRPAQQANQMALLLGHRFIRCIDGWRLEPGHWGALERANLIAPSPSLGFLRLLLAGALFLSLSLSVWRPKCHCVADCLANTHTSMQNGLAASLMRLANLVAVAERLVQRRLQPSGPVMERRELRKRERERIGARFH